MHKFQKQIRELESKKGFHIFFQESPLHPNSYDVINDHPNNESFCTKIE